VEKIFKKNKKTALNITDSTMEKKGDKPKTRQFGAKRGPKTSSKAEKPASRSRRKPAEKEFNEENGVKRSFRKTTTAEKNTKALKSRKAPLAAKEEDTGRKFTGGRKFGGAKRTEKPSFRKKEPAEEPRKKRKEVVENELLKEIYEKRAREGRSTPQKQKVLSLTDNEKQGLVRLNKYISNAGICSRRDADVLIVTGAISVNGEVVTELGYKVLPTDVVRYGDKILQNEKPVYVLLNKPKDYITTTDDERGRKNVMDLVRGACKERIYPVGRLDKNTTGLLLFTNDGDMTKKLTHPKHGIEKTYSAELNKKFANIDMCALRNGIELEDGIITPDDVQYVDDSKKVIGITIHSGKNRIVRRIFEFLGYEVVKLDRVVFAGLTKKDLPRGKWRFLTQAEINILKMTIK
jgi:23S rRNA pseudouridine2605 synthase